MLFHYSKSFPRLLRVLCLATNVIVTLFLQALTYNLTNPDDGSCGAYTADQECTEETGAFGDGSSKCYWEQGNVKGICYFREPAETFQVILFVAIFAALVST